MAKGQDNGQDSGPQRSQSVPIADPEPDPLEGSNPERHRFECRSCGFVYDPDEGIRKLSIAAGTPFSALDPVGFRCPVCRSRVGAFRDIGPRSQASGF